MKAPSSSDLRALAEEMDRLQRMESWCKDLLANPGCINLQPRIEWAWASSCTGYEDLQNAVRVLLRDGAAEQLIATALTNQRQKVAELKQTILGSGS